MSCRALAALFALALGPLGCGPRDEDVWIIGHRGSPLEAPENSMEGFRLAYEQGADGIEFDVQLTADGHNVVMHDDALDRTTDCKGLVSGHTLASLSTCALNNGQPIQTLPEMLAATAGWFELSFLEIKVPEDQAADRTLEQTDAAIAAVQASGYAERIVIISYDATCLHRVAARRGEGIMGGWDDTSGESISDANRYDLGWILMPVRELEPWMGDIAIGLDKQVSVYGVNTPSDFVRATEGGAVALMSDSVSVLASLVGKKPRDLPRP